ncbi:uncharacterized protein LTR77_004043 [Saxophila tyrrhenica]|uniref:SET domain-containing protein n=1 Tax=Saxophila tyrrhenica TaxID=1690608 RepID=A0AAV9PBI1_9PEZI|nr:hypothetical protein LTR77_004043 [Saxophila tyrrhenica]
MYNIRNAGAKGFGVFATRAIQRGTRILAELPTFTITSDRDLLPAFRRLSLEARKYISELSVNANKKPAILDWSEAAYHVFRGALTTTPRSLFSINEYSTLLAAFRNNCFNIGDDRRAIFHDISRLNHSCVPNAQGNFNTAIDGFAVHATHLIESRQEITISYLAEHGAVRSSRQAKLAQGYGFACGCPVCDGSTVKGAESEERRRVVREQLGVFSEGEQGGREELEMMMSLIEMFEREGLAGRELGTMYLSAAESNCKLNDPVAAKECSRLGLDMEQRCLGVDSPLYRESMARMRKIRAV